VDRERGAGESDPSYDKMLTLEHLESLLEELEEDGFDGYEGHALPLHLREQLEELGLSDAEEVRHRISQLHNELDQAD
jgi:hypothetical protein